MRHSCKCRGCQVPRLGKWSSKSVVAGPVRAKCASVRPRRPRGRGGAARPTRGMTLDTGGSASVLSPSPASIVTWALPAERVRPDRPCVVRRRQGSRRSDLPMTSAAGRSAPALHAQCHRGRAGQRTPTSVTVATPARPRKLCRVRRGGRQLDALSTLRYLDRFRPTSLRRP